MKKKYFISILIFIIALLALYFNARLQLIEGGNPNSNSPEEAIKKGVLIRQVNTHIKEIIYDNKQSVLIDKAWLEKKVIEKDRILWVEKDFDPQRFVLKVSYLIKDRNDDKVYKNPGFRVVFDKNDGDITFTEKWNNVIGVDMEGDPQKEFVLEVRVDKDKGELVTFR